MKAALYLLTLLFIAFSMPVFAAPDNAFNYVAAFKQAQEKRQEADRKLRAAMEDAADWLVGFRLRSGHFPEPGLEQERATAALQKRILGCNPYSATGVPQLSELKPCPIRFVNQSVLGPSQVKDWEKSVPTDWRALPGTVTVIHNNYDYLVLWGASADQLPIFDAKLSKLSLVWRELEN